MVFEVAEEYQGYNGYSVDLYAAGKVLLKMVLGNEVEETEDSISNKLSDELIELLAGMLHSVPFNRFDLEQVLEHKWV
jgi:hypothetical protein